jgi:hypothetical protein
VRKARASLRPSVYNNETFGENQVVVRNHTLQNAEFVSEVKLIL